MKKDYKLIHALYPIRNFNTYSKYNESLEKVFKKRSLKTLLYSLNNPVKFNENYIDENLIKKEIDRNLTDNNSHDKNLLEYNYEDYLLALKEKRKKNKKTEPWSINIKTPRIPPTKRKLDFYKYNPNYNSIYKNIPSFSFVKSTKKKINEDNKKKIIKNRSNNLFLKPKNKNESNSNSSKSKNKNKILPLLTAVNSESPKTIHNELRRNNSNNLYDKNNHTFRFSKYCPRKPIEAKVNNKITYLENYDYLLHMNKTIDFKKMPKRNVNNLIYTNTLDTPSLCYYNPRYDCVEIETKKISFNPESFRKTIKYKKNKKLKNIIMSYDVNKEYLTIDNSKLVKTEAITKLLNL